MKENQQEVNKFYDENIENLYDSEENIEQEPKITTESHPHYKIHDENCVKCLHFKTGGTEGEHLGYCRQCYGVVPIEVEAESPASPVKTRSIERRRGYYEHTIIKDGDRVSEELVKTPLKENGDRIEFGSITVGYKTLKVYALLNRPNIVFFRINNEFIAFDKFLLRKLFSLYSKGGWYLGVFGKKPKKYMRKPQAIASSSIGGEA